MADHGLIARTPSVVQVRTDDRVVLYHPDRGLTLVLNPSGSLVWEALAEPQTAAALAECLCSRWPALPLENAHGDVEHFLGELRQRSMVTMTG